MTNKQSFQQTLEELQARREPLKTAAIEAKARLDVLRTKHEELKQKAFSIFKVSSKEELAKAIADTESSLGIAVARVSNALSLFDQGNYSAALRALGVKDEE